MQAWSPGAVSLAAHMHLHLQAMPAFATKLPVALLAAAWVLNQAVRTARLRASSNFEMRASFNLLRGEDLWWRMALALIAAAFTPLFLTAGLPLLATGTALAAVLLGRHLFFVSVVPLSMGLTFLRPQAGQGVHA